MRVALAVTGIVLSIGASVRAQPSDPRRRDAGFIGKDIPLLEIDQCPAVPGVTDAELRRRGSEHYQRGEVLYVQGDYRGAVDELVASYCLIPYYTILKDIGQAYERELEYARAIAYFERYVISIPSDAQPANACAPNPQDDKQNVQARIQVLQSLRAKILVETEPADAKITILDDLGVVQARGVSGQLLEVRGGHYQLKIERGGYRTLTREIPAEIGKPYTYFERLEAVKGRLRVRVVPADAHLYLDHRQLPAGNSETELPGGRYTLTAEAPGHVSVTQEVDVLPDRDTPVSLELPPEPQFGPRQLMAYAGVGGAVAGGLLAGAQDNPGLWLLGTALGAGAGLLGTHYGAPRVPLGTSSLTITSSLIGGIAGTGTSLLVTDNGNVAAPLIGAGLLLGAGVGYYAGQRWHVSPGDAAIVNSGALWGTAAGMLFVGSFDASAKVGSGMVLSGLGMGTIGGVVLTRYFSVSRERAVLIDVGGGLGGLLGIAAENIYTSARGQTLSDQQQSERGANFTLAGVATGLIVAGVLTRNMDAPKLVVTPTVGQATAADGRSTATFGVGGTF